MSTAARTLPARIRSRWERIPRWLRWAYVGAAVLYTVPPVVLYLFYRQPAFDLAIYDQSIWLLAHGELFNTVAGIHVFGAHFSPVLYLLAPLAHVPGGAIPELVFEGLFAASAVFPLRAIARRLDGDEKALVLLGVVHPGVFGALWWGVRPWNMAYPFLLWAASAILRRPDWTTIALFGLTGLVFREDIGLWVGLAALVLFLARKVTWRQLVIGGVPVAVATGLILGVLMPRWSPVGSYLYDTTVLGASDEATALRLSATLGRIAFLLLPVLAIPRNAWRLRWLLAVPLVVPLIGLAQRGGTSLRLTYHYELLLVAIVTIVVALSARVVLRPKPIIVGSLVGALLLGVLSPFTPSLGANPFAIRASHASTHASLAEEISDYDQSTALSAPNSLVAHVSERERIFIFPYPFDAIYPEPYPMDCPSPDIVVASEIDADTPNWDRARDTDYIERWSEGGFTLFELRDTASSSGRCGPAG